MGSFISSIFGGGGSNTVQSTVAEVSEEERKAKKARQALYATETGVQGQELSAGDVVKRNTLLGN